MWSVDVIEENGRFVVRTKIGDDIHDVPFTIEGFAHLYARGQRVHYKTLAESAKDIQAELLAAPEVISSMDASNSEGEPIAAIKPRRRRISTAKSTDAV